MALNNEQFPYNMSGRHALVTLIRETFPQYVLNPDTFKHSVPYHAPDSETPGRTYIRVTDLHISRWLRFVYRRLDIAIALPGNINVDIKGAITPRKIVDAINSQFGMNFDHTDVQYSDRELLPAGTSATYRFKALPGSLVWYGETLVRCNSQVDTNVRLMESGEPRLLETGQPRLLEV